VYVQHGSADHAIIRARSIASEILMMSEQGSASSAPRVAPHPLLKSYYADEPARKRRVNEMFDSSAPHYDWITGAMSFGTGRWYRGDVLKRHGVTAGTKLLDVGSGTGVIAALAQEMVGPTGVVVAVDPSEGMLAEAKKAGVRDVRMGRGENLPVGDGEFDILTMGYALRHVEDLVTTFREYRRALKPGGKVLLLEITRPDGRVHYAFLKFYLKHVVPRITRIVRRSREAEELMRYYWDTIEACVPPADIMAALTTAGFTDVKRHVLNGMFSEYSATKPAAGAAP
jgi:demethylmenaquinone methyltransferase/2-methoxy-6-polyprenyl-1,4-benzoquinol methylase